MVGTNFYPRSPCGERHCASCMPFFLLLFLSTLSLRRATQPKAMISILSKHFYPRSPCGERRHQQAAHAGAGVISIHALLAESDLCCVSCASATACYFYPRSPCGERRCYAQARTCILCISIHALLAESDHAPGISLLCGGNFYPRSPCGERHVLANSATFKELFLSTLSLRRATLAFLPAWRNRTVFLSTLSLRRATRNTIRPMRELPDFYPRSPCGERRSRPRLLSGCRVFLSTLSLRRATVFISSCSLQYHDFYPRSPCGERPVYQVPPFS